MVIVRKRLIWVDKDKCNGYGQIDDSVLDLNSFSL